MALVSCKDLVLAYGKNIAVEIADLEIFCGDYFCIVGENGSGKSTFLKGLLGLKHLSSGRIIFDGLKKSDIGYMPQKIGVRKDFPASVFEIVLSGCLNSIGFLPFYSRVAKNVAFESLKLLEIENLKNKPFKFLSRGQQQRVLLARAVCSAKKLLFLDEPCNSLDPAAASCIYDVIKYLNKEKNIAIVMVSHDLDFVKKNATRVLHLKRVPVFCGDVAEYCKSDIEKHFLRG